ncbi:hypothetical protein CEXT_171191 [Caerostris extrusa]|uniref:Uncharacterized protein n=1 Tax=Caerostris extrusa TaxID=172846 RepID=A0AAV4YG47_CAEEX|nr:hypothetical protein CEXT_171191 [Caerostris extrusa]
MEKRWLMSKMVHAPLRKIDFWQKRMNRVQHFSPNKDKQNKVPLQNENKFIPAPTVEKGSPENVSRIIPVRGYKPGKGPSFPERKLLYADNGKVVLCKDIGHNF